MLLLQNAHPSSRAAAADPPILIDGVPSIVTSTLFAMVTPRIEAGRPPLLGVLLLFQHTHTEHTSFIMEEQFDTLKGTKNQYQPDILGMLQENTLQIINNNSTNLNSSKKTSMRNDVSNRNSSSSFISYSWLLKSATSPSINL